MAKQKEKEKLENDDRKKEMKYRYSQRTRKKIDYSETNDRKETNSDHSSDSDLNVRQFLNVRKIEANEYELESSSEDEKPLKKRQVTNNLKSIKNDNVIKKSMCDEGFQQIKGFIVRPDLSEDDSSDSDNEVLNLQNKTRKLRGEVALELQKIQIKVENQEPTKEELFEKDAVSNTKARAKRKYHAERGQQSEQRRNIKSNDHEIETQMTENTLKHKTAAGNDDKLIKEDVEQKNKSKLSLKKRKFHCASNIEEPKMKSAKLVKDNTNSELKKKDSTKGKRNRKDRNISKKKTYQHFDNKSKENLEEQEESEDSEEEWEDVDEARIKTSPKKREVHKAVEKKVEVKDLEISVGVKSIHKKKKSHAEKMFVWVRQLMGRVLRERQVALHKCHILCLLAKCIRENQICNNQDVQGICLSLLNMEFFKDPVSRWDVSHVRRLLNWLLTEDVITHVYTSVYTLDEKIQNEVQYLNLSHIFVVILRALGFLSRLVCSLQPLSAKLKGKDATSPESSSRPAATDNKGIKCVMVAAEKSGPDKIEQETTKSPYFTDKNKSNQKSSVSKTAKQLKSASAKSMVNSKKCSSKDKTSIKNSEVQNEKHRRYSHRKRESISYNEGGKTINTGNDVDDDSDFEIKKERLKKKRSSKKISLNETAQAQNKQTRNGVGNNTWVEVYLNSMKKWICVEFASQSINEPAKCETIATKPLQYVIGLDNKEKIKDITCRYAVKWLSVNRKLRIDRDWWETTLKPYALPDDVISRSEDAQLKQTMLKQDFPKSISEFKDHPLYALSRHLLKFQAIYPESAVPLGYIRNEAIYSRDCVKELHTRETWMKQARVVKPAEIPYKIVKGRPKRSTPILERDNVKVETFGLWQTEVYVPPPVIDGKVPKNEYGNIELFQPSMLPKGAVHLPMGNMQKIARKMNVDYAPAMMGWDFHSGYCHPIIEGIVVAKEFEDRLLDAWRREEEEQERKEKEKQEKRVYENWKMLIKGLMIRNKLQNKYKFEDTKTSNQSIQKSMKKENTKHTRSNQHKKKGSAKSTIKDEYSDLSVSWPMNRMGGQSTIADEGHVHVFPEAKYIKDESTNTKMKVCSCGLKIPVDGEEKL